MKKYFIITYINGIKNYVRRFRVGQYAVAVTMFASTKEKAKYFEKKERAEYFISKMGIGYSIEEEAK